MCTTDIKNDFQCYDIYCTLNVQNENAWSLHRVVVNCEKSSEFGGIAALAYYYLKSDDCP